MDVLSELELMSLMKRIPIQENSEDNELILPSIKGEYRSADNDSMVNLLEKLPAPYGLVRTGVAPDHQLIKKSAEKFALMTEPKEFNYIASGITDHLRSTLPSTIFLKKII